MLRKLITLILLVNTISFASDHGIYLQLVKNAKNSVEEMSETISKKLSSMGFQVLAQRNVATPDIVRESESDQCGFIAKQIIFTSEKYQDLLTSYGNKYIVGGFLRLAIYENENGSQVNIVDPETINRIVFNDLFENDKETQYKEIITKTKKIKSEIIAGIHSLAFGKNVELAQEPIRSDEDLAESSKDMFMMVGPMTFFNDEDQFPVLYKEKASSVENQITNIVSQIKNNIEKAKPSKDDLEYRFTKSPEVLKWKVIGEVYSKDKSAVLLGLTRERTEGLSMHIAGKSRENVKNKCPGLDHAAAFPIEVLIYSEGKNVVVRTAREMFRMDMFFWDAGMKAFMDHMSMPNILDESLKQILTLK